MPYSVPVVKGQAYGNDFLLVPADAVETLDASRLAIAMCRRLEGIGADGMMVYRWESTDRVAMRLYNSDGSESEVSGNGVRCLAALAVHKHRELSQVTIDTPAGPKVLELIGRSGTALTFRASMGLPQDIHSIEFEAAGERVQAVALSVGNPQCVLLEQTLDDARLQRLGPAIEHHPRFPNRTNVSFARVETPERVRILIWERGVGPTMASGTGACGAAVAAASYGGAARTVDVISPGGTQRVEWREDNIYLTGWAKLVFDGVWMADSA
jgi:diaminopimelate epimerase